MFKITTCPAHHRTSGIGVPLDSFNKEAELMPKTIFKIFITLKCLANSASKVKTAL